MGGGASTQSAGSGDADTRKKYEEDLRGLREANEKLQAELAAVKALQTPGPGDAAGAGAGKGDKRVLNIIHFNDICEWRVAALGKCTPLSATVHVRETAATATIGARVNGCKSSG